MRVSQETRTHPKILWVDDHIDAYQFCIDELKNQGADVYPMSSSAQALEIAANHKHQFDAILLDMKMPGKNGIDLLSEIRPLQRNAGFALVSSYFYLRSFHDQLDNIHVDMKFDKNKFPDPGTPKVLSEFVFPILHLANRKGESVPSSQVNAQRVERDPFDTTYDEYMNLPIDQRLDLLSMARDRLQGVTKREFENGAVWLLFCGSSESPIVTARRANEVLSNEEISKRARELNRAPFHFSAPVDVDDVSPSGQWGVSCKTADGLVNYPTVSLEFEENKFCVHFDTGSPCTFFSCEELADTKLIQLPDLILGEGYCNKGRYQYATFKMQGMLCDQEAIASATRSVIVEGHAVLNWDTSPFARHCGNGCQDSSTKKKGRVSVDDHLCQYRQALVGRNLLTDNKLCLILDGERRITKLYLPAPQKKRNQ